MKNRMIYVWLPVIMGLVSCNDWLDVSPKSEIKAEKLFETESGFKDALIGIYVEMTNKQVYGMNLSWGAIDFLGGLYQAPNGRYGQFQRFNYKNTNSLNIIEETWLKQYHIIANVNLLLESLEKQGGILNQTTYNIIKGEALALRAMLHFDLMRLYAKGNLGNKKEYLAEPSIPYVVEYSKVTTEQKSYRETLDLIHRDIQDALQCLISDPLYPNPVERAEEYDELMENIFFAGTIAKGRETRMSYPAALLLNARVYLWEGDQKNALEYAGKVISACEFYVKSGKKVWASESGRVAETNTSPTKDFVFQEELLFSLDVTKLSEYLIYAYEFSVGGSVNLDRLIQTTNFVNELFSFNSGEANSDLRYNNQYELAADVKASVFNIKIRKTGTIYCSNILPLMRMSEAYLIAAECLITQDKTKAVEYMNFLKLKRNIREDYYLADNISDADLLNAIVREYRKEYFSEGQVFFCYKRLGLNTFPGIQSGDKQITDEQYKLPYPNIEQDLGGRK